MQPQKQMPERLKQKTNDELFKVKPLGEESLKEMKAARCRIARLLDWSRHFARRISGPLTLPNQPATPLVTS